MRHADTRALTRSGCRRSRSMSGPYPAARLSVLPFVVPGSGALRLEAKMAAKGPGSCQNECVDRVQEWA